MAQAEHILQTELERYAALGLYPLHMPGHKRRLAPAPGLPFGWDVTEVPGVDDLHDANGILAAAMARTAALFGAAQSWYLVNGSTCGILAGIRALAPAGSRIIAARNCHKSVYHAVELGGLTVHWITPPPVPGFGVCGSVPPAAVEAALAACPDAACVVLTSPTYEGVLSDIAAIAELCHRRGVPLLVDEAHGAHLGLFAGWPQSAVRCGADVVVQSAHKTLPSLTQTALLHRNGSLVSAAALKRQLDVFETSSPSYPLLASLDGCTGLLQSRGAELFGAWRQALAEFDAAATPLRRLRLLCHGGDTAARPELFGYDPGKLCVNTAAAGCTAAALATALRTRWGFETEMACGCTLLAMTSPADDADALLRFARALLALDAELPGGAACPQPALPAPGPARLPIAEALRRPACELPMAHAAGRTAAEYLWAYPPGVPLIAPGEEVTPRFLAAAAALEAAGTRLRHTHAAQAGALRVIGPP